MKYSYSKDLNSSFESTENKVREALQNIGFGVLTEISITDAFKSKLDLDFKNYKILGACNPPLAHEAINFDEMIGILMPCNILLIDNEDGTTKVVVPNDKSLCSYLFLQKFSNVPLSNVILVTLASGIFIGYILALSSILASKTESRLNRNLNKKLNDEINSLRNISIEDEDYEEKEEE